MSLYLAPNEDVISTPGQAEITEVRAFVSCSDDYEYDMAMAFEHIHLAEFMMMSEQADHAEPNFGTLFTNERCPKRPTSHCPIHLALAWN
ncbi:MAG: hypothetical protein MK179_10835 [Pirellulaceae bacterium]|nr:hypothetical protein [Pirellulaceae bacterium]